MADRHLKMSNEILSESAYAGKQKDIIWIMFSKNILGFNCGWALRLFSMQWLYPIITVAIYWQAL